MSDTILTEAIAQLRDLVEQARVRGEPESNAATLATADPTNARPSARTVYIHFDADSAVFFVNARAGKGQHLQWNPQAALCFFWRQIAHQVVVEGAVEPLDEPDAEHFWQQRPRASTLGARASQSHAPEADKAALDERLRREKSHSDFAPVERPEHWIGYRLRPDRRVFWDTGWQRMRLRRSIERQIDGAWQVSARQP